MKLDEEFRYLVLSIVMEIPEGKVATYGQIASLAGYKKNARLVGKVLSSSNFHGDYPAHRVVNSNGRCAPYFERQKGLLLDEGITFKDNGNVDLKKHQWKI